MPKQIDSVVSTKNVKAQEFKGTEDAEAGLVTVAVKVTIPESFAEASSEEFYGSETVALDAVQQDWARRCLNTARPILRAAETAIDWEYAAQTAVDSYKPGRKGGFAPKVTAEELDSFDSMDDLKAFLAKRGVVGAAKA